MAADDEGRDQVARAVVFDAPRRVRVGPVDLPSPGDGDVLVRTLWSGISAGTEMLAYRGEIDPALPLDETIGTLGGSFAFPFRYGYSCVGRIERSRRPALISSISFWLTRMAPVLRSRSQSLLKATGHSRIAKRL